MLDHLADVARFEGSGVHYAATAVEAGLCEGEEIIVVGGVKSTGQAAVFRSRHASHVHVLLAASMSRYLVGRIAAVPERITLQRRTEITALTGERHLEQVTWPGAPAGARSGGRSPTTS